MISFTTVGLIGLAIAWWRIGWFPTLMILLAGTCVGVVTQMGEGARNFLKMVDNAVASGGRSAANAAVGMIADHHHVVAAVFG